MANQEISINWVALIKYHEDNRLPAPRFMDGPSLDSVAVYFYTIKPEEKSVSIMKSSIPRDRTTVSIVEELATAAFSVIKVDINWLTLIKHHKENKLPDPPRFFNHPLLNCIILYFHTEQREERSVSMMKNAIQKNRSIESVMEELADDALSVIRVNNNLYGKSNGAA